MKKLVFNYAPIRFRPYRETGEFVNVGVVAHCPQTDFFDFRIQVKKVKRVSDFFPELDIRILKDALNGLKANLRRRSSRNSLLPAKIQQVMLQFEEVVRPREGIIHFGPTGSSLVADPNAAVDDLYLKFVERQFAKAPKYREVVMGNRLDRFLKEWKVSDSYARNQRLGDLDYHVRMPFAIRRESRIERVIRPINLSHDEVSDMMDHAGTWIGRMERLRKRGCFPKTVIFPVQLPTDEERLKRALEMCDEMRAIGILTPKFSEVPGEIADLQRMASEGLEIAA